MSDINNEIKLDLGSNTLNSNNSKLDNNLDKPTEFLSDLSIFDISKVFTTFDKEKRILIIPIGFPQAGKSLLLSSLMYYARK